MESLVSAVSERTVWSEQGSLRGYKDSMKLFSSVGKCGSFFVKKAPLKILGLGVSHNPYINS